MQSRILTVFSAIGRLITFRLTREEFLQFNLDYLMVGIVCTWLVGIGRTLHNSRVEWWQHLGLGSVAYIFVLSFLLWVLLLPLRIQNLSYRHILTFVSLTSPTGFIYAVPVEWFLSVDAASTVRVGFLAIVATWRVALWVFYLLRFCRLTAFSTLIVSILPLCAIVTLLTILNLDKVVYDLMAGFVKPSSDDGSFTVVFIGGIISVYAFIPLLLIYLVIVGLVRFRPKQ